MATGGSVENMDDPFEYPDVNPENSDITDLNPKGEPQYFFLARLIRYEDDAGGTFVEQNDANQYLPLGRDRPAFDLDDPNFSMLLSMRTSFYHANLMLDVAFGDLLLYVNRADQREFQCMRNYAGQAKLVPRRMLMPLHFPFSMGGFPLRTKGVPIDIAFAKTAISVGTNGSHDVSNDGFLFSIKSQIIHSFAVLILPLNLFVIFSAYFTPEIFLKHPLLTPSFPVGRHDGIPCTAQIR